MNNIVCELISQQNSIYGIIITVLLAIIGFSYFSYFFYLKRKIKKLKDNFNELFFITSQINFFRANMIYVSNETFSTGDFYLINTELKRNLEQEIKSIKDSLKEYYPQKTEKELNKILDRYYPSFYMFSDKLKNTNFL